MRSIPRSRRHPQFGSEALAAWLPESTGCQYCWEPLLGGFRRPLPQSVNVALGHPSFRGYADYMETGSFRVALDRLVLRAAEERTAVMCSETLWWRCHRRLIADAAVLLHGISVSHLMHDGSSRAHMPTSEVRVTPEGTLRYDGLVTPDAMA